MHLITPHTELIERHMDRSCAPAGERTVPHWLIWIASVVSIWIPYVLMRMRVHGKENLRALEGKTGAVIVGNHTSYPDPYFIVISSMPKQWVRFMAKDDLFTKGHGLGGFFLSRLGVLPVKRDSADRAGIKRAVKMLAAGEFVGIFPEGTRRDKTERAATLSGGAAFMARMANVPVLPVGIRGADRLVVNHHPNLPKISLHYGEPVWVDDFDFLPRGERLDAMTWFFMREVHALSRGIAPEEVDMDALYPGSKSYAEVLAGFVPPSRLRAEEEARKARVEAGMPAGDLADNGEGPAEYAGD